MGKDHRPIRWAFTKDILKRLLKQVGNANHVEFQGVQLLFKMSIIMGMFIFFYVSSSKSSVVDSADLDFIGTNISTCTCIHDI